MKKMLCFFSLLIVVSFCGCFEENKVADGINKTIVNNSKVIGVGNFTLNDTLNKTNQSEKKYEKEKNNTTINKTQNFDFSKIDTQNVPIDDIFLNLNYVNEIDASNDNGKRKIKIYKINDITVVFDVSEYRINFYDAMEYNKVKKYGLRDKFGSYICYEFTPYNQNGTKSYCYVRKIGKYWIIMSFNKKDKKVNELWKEWNEYIISRFKK
ncbi:hypothetical protein [Methanotorris igneus]|uniref:Lipoprotein n=1 Tax=Methanotorris igneus (strain DSM 5666 / JCM 11834 / Kol 5) TaxID=880724 RepID=F6BDR9_METIK|nr:hypothetical protein [Methanotorris igneus]AEF96630.1 hypothetical protein Metig_1091 [Methanotorris igneus Kol 5]